MVTVMTRCGELSLKSTGGRKKSKEDVMVAIVFMRDIELTTDSQTVTISTKKLVSFGR